MATVQIRKLGPKKPVFPLIGLKNCLDSLLNTSLLLSEKYRGLKFKTDLIELALQRPIETSNFTCAESNANEQEQNILLISIRFGTCKVPRLIRV